MIFKITFTAFTYINSIKSRRNLGQNLYT